jgi:hypothetical protein
VSPAQARTLLASRATCDALAPGSGLTDREVVEALRALVEHVEREAAHVAEVFATGVSVHKAYARGGEAERAAVVAWLRGDAGFRMVPGDMPYCDYYADAIERGEHLGGAVKREDGPAHVTIPGHPTDICRHGVPLARPCVGCPPNAREIGADPRDIGRHGLYMERKPDGQFVCGFCGGAVDVFGMPCPAKVAP